MKAVILAAGYATRLYPLTKNRPKPLLLVKERPIVNYLLDKIAPVDEISEVIVVTNDKFANHFRDWAHHNRDFPKHIRVANDGTTTNEDRLGSIGDIRFVVREFHILEDLLVLGGDNLFDFGIEEYVRFSKGKSPHATVGLFDIHDLNWAKSFGVVQLDQQNKIVSFEEKPSRPKSTLIAMCLYYFPKESFDGFEEYLGESKAPDASGGYISWLYKKNDVYGFPFSGQWYDIGSLDAYKEAQKAFLLNNRTERTVLQ